MAKKTKAKSNPETVEVNVYREELMARLKVALAEQEKKRLDNSLNNIKTTPEVAQIMAELMIESSKFDLAEDVKRRREANQAAIKAEQEASLSLSFEKENSMKNPSPPIIIAPEVAEDSAKQWVATLEASSKRGLQNWNEAIKKDMEKVDRAYAKIRQILLEEAEAEQKTKTESNQSDADFADDNIIKLPSNKEFHDVFPKIDNPSMEFPKKLSLWKRFKLWLISKLQD